MIERMFDVLDELEQALDKVAADDPAVDVARLRRLVDRAEFLWIRTARASERAGEWQADGAVSPTAWLRERCGLSHSSASSALRIGRMLEAMPEVAEAFATVETSRQHVATIEHAYIPQRRDAVAVFDDVFATATRALGPKDLRQIVSRIADTIDGDDGLANDQARHARRRLHLSRTLDEMGAVDGLLDPEQTEIIQTALEAVMEQERGTDDTRTTAQRRADALVSLCRVGLAHAEIGPGRRNPAHLSGTFDVEALERRAEPDLAHTVRAEAAHGPLSVATLRRIACDANISRVITDGRSQPLDVGRSSRVVTAALWRALVVRDGGCTHPGCDRPPGWCQAHHIKHWVDGGTTTLDNLKLLCDRHHIDEHADDHPPYGPDPPYD
jgi:hypothetical protein